MRQRGHESAEWYARRAARFGCGGVGLVAAIYEWTRSGYRPLPYEPAADMGPNGQTAEDAVRGGSWATRPSDTGSAWRWKYPAWRKVHDVGFRVAVEIE